MTGTRILVVDDEPQITRVLRTTLTAQQYDIRIANDGATALDILKEWPPDLVVTDVNMPIMDGLELCRRIRELSQVPIIVLSVREDEHTKVKALDLGADDYVTKPFNMKELLARVRANLRRVPSGREMQDVIDVGDFHIDVGEHSVTVKGQEVRLTPKEFELLLHLARHPGKVVTHRVLLTSIWGPNSADQLEYLRVNIHNLRKKIEGEGPSPYIENEPGIGYRFLPEN